MTHRRVYIVEDNQGNQTLVDAANQAQALRHIVADRFKCRVATTLEVATIISNGGMLQKAGDAPEKREQEPVEEVREPVVEQDDEEVELVEEESEDDEFAPTEDAEEEVYDGGF